MRTAEKIFNSVVKGSNCFTPRLVAYYKIDDNSAIELSTVKSRQPKGLTQSGFMENVFGVTVVFNGSYNSDLSKLFDTEKDAIDYINTFNPIQKQYYERYNSYGDTKLVTEKIG